MSIFEREQRDKMNRTMIPVGQSCSIQQALWMLTLLEAQNIEAFFEVAPADIRVSTPLNGYVVVDPLYLCEAEQALKKWNALKIPNHFFAA